MGCAGCAGCVATEKKNIMYQIHVTVDPSTPEQEFIKACSKAKVEPKILENGTVNIEKDLFTSSKIDNFPHMESARIYDSLVFNSGLRVVRCKVETVPWHPATELPLCKGNYFELHIPAEEEWRKWAPGLVYGTPDNKLCVLNGLFSKTPDNKIHYLTFRSPFKFDTNLFIPGTRQELVIHDSVPNWDLKHYQGNPYRMYTERLRGHYSTLPIFFDSDSSRHAPKGRCTPSPTLLNIQRGKVLTCG